MNPWRIIGWGIIATVCVVMFLIFCMAYAVSSEAAERVTIPEAKHKVSEAMVPNHPIVHCKRLRADRVLCRAHFRKERVGNLTLYPYTEWAIVYPHRIKWGQP